MKRIVITGIELEPMGGKTRVNTHYHEHKDGEYVIWEDAKTEIDRLHQEIAILRARIAELEAPKK